jgi:hypothetical protein
MQGNTHSPKPYYHNQIVKAESQCVRVALSQGEGGGHVHTSHRIVLSGLNLAYEGLLLGRRDEGHKESSRRSSTSHIDLHPLHNYRCTFRFCFAEGGNLT